MIKINFDFKETLDKILGGEAHSYCYQCGACVGDCPAARYSENFNPRLIVLKTMIGQGEELTAKGSIIWECTNCFNCWERCPQNVRPIEVIIALKTMSTALGNSPDKIGMMVEAVMKTGRTAVITNLTHKIRNQFGLKPLNDLNVDELNKIVS